MKKNELNFRFGEKAVRQLIEMGIQLYIEKKEDKKVISKLVIEATKEMIAKGNL